MNRETRRKLLKGGVLIGTDPPATTPRVAVGFCHGALHTTPQFRRSLAYLYQYDARSRPTPWIVGEYDHEASGVHVPDARCAIVQQFLDDPNEPEWLVMFDDDATFAPDILDRFIECANRETAPIVGALAFGCAPVKDAAGHELFNDVGAVEYDLFPTLYYFDDGGAIRTMFEYERDALVQVHSTGCHAFIAHRDVYADWRWRADGHPLPWFRVVTRTPTTSEAPEGYDGCTTAGVATAAIVSEDQFFFIRAGSFGYPVHVHTGIRTGHVKTVIWDEDAYLRNLSIANLVAVVTAEPEEADDAAQG